MSALQQAAAQWRMLLSQMGHKWSVGVCHNACNALAWLDSWLKAAQLRALISVGGRKPFSDSNKKLRSFCFGFEILVERPCGEIP